MCIGSNKDLEILKRIGEIVAITREEMIASIKPGITTKELDEIGGRILKKYGARSAPKHEYGFPGNTCISINDVAAHGIPDSRVIREGDTVNVDVSAELEGYYADTGATIAVEPILSRKKELCECSKSALYKGIEKARAGTRLNRIGKAIYEEAASKGFTVIKNLTGHGIGRKLHEEPHYILNYCDIWDKTTLTHGIVLAVETFISTGAQFVKEEKDGWTMKTPDKSIVAQYEHTIVVSDGEPLILTAI